jgi:hypothetical protein
VATTMKGSSAFAVDYLHCWQMCCTAYATESYAGIVLRRLLVV